MGLQLNKTLTTKSGLTIPVDNIIISSIHFPRAIILTAKPALTIKRFITYDLFNYTTVDEVQTDVDQNKDIQGGVVEFPAGYTREMTPAEYAAILADGSLAEVWLKDYIDGIMGSGTATIIDPYV